MKKYFCITLAMFFLLSLGVVRAQEAASNEGKAIEAAETATATAEEMAAMTDEELKTFLSGLSGQQFAEQIAIAANSGNRALARRVLLIANKILAERGDDDLYLLVDKLNLGGLDGDGFSNHVKVPPARGPHTDLPSVPEKEEEEPGPVPPPPPPVSGRSYR